MLLRTELGSSEAVAQDEPAAATYAQLTREDEGVPPLPEPDRPLIGRTDELADLTARALEAGTPSTILLGGDAGVGKTRLLAELTDRARTAGARVLVGHCLDLGDSSAPYLPLSEMFARLAQEDHDLAKQIVANRPLLSPLLPEFYRRSIPADLPGDRGSFFDAVHMQLEELAEDGPVLAIIEDAHWADRSTRELLTFLFTRRFRGPVSLVVSYRSDDLNRRHPLRAKLAEWSRLLGMHRIMLDPLSDAEVRDLLRSLRPDVDPSGAARIVARAGGNPFFAEELLAASQCGDGGLPDELADLLLVRIDALSDEARTVVRAASVSGRAVNHQLLAQVVNVGPAELDAALRAVVDSHVFETTPSGGYAFRHALLGEAVYDDLLPGERVRLHWQFADALRSQSGPGAAAALAHHARAAGNHELALSASISAGDQAMASAGPADAARLYEDALSLIAENPSTPSPIAHGDLVVRTARALISSGNPHRAVDVVGEAYDAHAGPLTERARLVATWVEARLLADVPNIGSDLIHEAMSWLEKEPPGETLASLNAVLARVLIAEDDFDGAMLAATEAGVLARDLDLPAVTTDSMTSLARLDDFAGDSEGAQTTLRALVSRARASGDISAELRALHQLSRVEARAELVPKATQTLAEAVRRADETGYVTDPFAVDSRTLGAHYAYLAGEWDLADQLLDMGDNVLPGLPASAIASVRMALDAGRGRDGVLDELPRLRPLWARDMFIAVHSAGAVIDVYGARGELDSMLEVYDDVVATVSAIWHVRYFDARIRLSALALGHIASAVIAGRAKGPAYAERAASMMEAVDAVVAIRSSEDALGLESRAWLCRARAELLRLEWAGKGSVPDDLLEQLKCSVEGFDRSHVPFEAARSRLRYAEGLAAAGQREEARDVAEEARVIAEKLGAASLVTAAARARRTAGGSPSGGAGAKPSSTATGGSADGVHLTPREREVLTLVVAGKTNGEIAAELFISTKTASVHVSNILAKVGAATRTEAAAIAHRDHLLTQAPTPSDS